MNDRPRVLLIDDERVLARAMSLRLKAAGYQVSVAHDGKSGLALALDHRPDAILLDVKMPGMDGISLLEELLQRNETNDIPVVMVSASPSCREEALEKGARYFFDKPYDSKTLLTALQTLITCSAEVARP